MDPADADKVQVKTVENTNTPQDLRKIDVSWGWRRLLFFSVVWAATFLLAYVIFNRPIADPVLMIFVRYTFYTMWLGLCLYGAQASVSELAQAAAIFFSGKRVIETIAPKNAVVETAPGPEGTAAKVVSGEPAATVAAASDGPGVTQVDPPEDAPWARR